MSQKKKNTAGSMKENSLNENNCGGLMIGEPRIAREDPMWLIARMHLDNEFMKYELQYRSAYGSEWEEKFRIDYLQIEKLVLQEFEEWQSEHSGLILRLSPQ